MRDWGKERKVERGKYVNEIRQWIKKTSDLNDKSKLKKEMKGRERDERERNVNVS